MKPSLLFSLWFHRFLHAGKEKRRQKKKEEGKEACFVQNKVSFCKSILFSFFTLIFFSQKQEKKFKFFVRIFRPKPPHYFEIGNMMSR